MELTTDHTSYQVGDFILVTVTGDTTGAAYAPFVDAFVEYSDPSLVDGYDGAVLYDVLTSSGFPWTHALPFCGNPGCYVFTQSAPVFPPNLPPDAGSYDGFLYVEAVAPGTLTLGIDASTYEWFGAPLPAAVEVPILAPPPLSKISDTEGYLSGPGSPGTNPGGLLVDGDQFGAAVEGIGDLDRDGVPDIAVGAIGDDTGNNFAGAVYILFLNADGTVKASQKIGEGTGGLQADLDDTDAFGTDIALIHDVDGDGVQDIAVAAPNDDDGGSNTGALYILFLDLDGTVKAEQKISNLDGGLGAVNDAEDGFGVSPASVGDLDGDGIPDIAVGSFLDNASGGNSGSLYILFLNADGTVKGSPQKITEGVGGFSGQLDVSDRFGSGVANLGDLDGDGRPELAVGARFDGADDGGAVYLLSLNTNGTVHAWDRIEDGAHGFTGPLNSEDRFHWTARVGDLDGDGVGDLAVGAVTDDDEGTDTGAVWILYLTHDGSSFQVHDQRKISRLPSLDFGDLFGIVTSPGDLDGDGDIDLFVGASRDDDGGDNRGAAYTLFLEGTAASCGNGVLDPVELCDDGNTVGGDGCPATCGLQAAAVKVPVASLPGLLSMSVLLAVLARWYHRRIA